MKPFINSLIIAIVSVGLGLAVGFWLFKGGGDETSTSQAAPVAEQETIWTCSMHPQIRQPEPGLCPICEMDLTPLAENTSDDPLALEMSETAIQLAAIQTSKVTLSGAAGKELLLQGKLQADERRTFSQVAHVPGRIEQLQVTFTGEEVRKGQPLARIYSPPLITAQQELLEALRLKPPQPQLVEAARQKLRNWKIPEAFIREVEESGMVQEQITVLAEAAGTVKTRKVAVGDYVSSGTPLFEMNNLDKLWVLLDAYEEDLASVQVGNEVTFTTPSLPGKRFQTTIRFIDPAINAQTRTASIRAEVSNLQQDLKPEMLVSATLRAALPGETRLVVPRSAVLWTGKRSVVYLKAPEKKIPTFVFREIEIGELLGDYYEVRHGLQEGEEVVTHGAFSIDAAAQLNNQQSMMNRLLEAAPEEDGILFDPQAIAPPFKDQLADVLYAYIRLKDALVETDASASAKEAQAVQAALRAVDGTTLEGDAQAFWRKQSDALRTHLAKLGSSKEVEAQRKQFEFVSDLLIETGRAFDLRAKGWYVQHCPMAFNDQGADWISLEDQIRNPYFGDKMLKCGYVVDSLLPE